MSVPFPVSHGSRHTDTWDKIRCAPSANTAFPDHANITAVEIITFFPRWLKTWDVIDRLVSNGVTAALIAFIINTNRTTGTEPIVPNSLTKMLLNSMRLRQPNEEYCNWTMAKHVVPEDWNHRTIDVTGFRTLKDTHKYVKNPEKSGWEGPFKDLAHYVKKMPSGADALDLTRCVEYHMKHPDETWVFPDHYDALVALTGGKAEVTERHLDGAAFARWAVVRKEELGLLSKGAASYPIPLTFHSRVQTEEVVKAVPPPPPPPPKDLVDIDLTGKKPLKSAVFFNTGDEYSSPRPKNVLHARAKQPTQVQHTTVPQDAAGEDSDAWITTDAEDSDDGWTTVTDGDDSDEENNPPAAHHSTPLLPPRKRHVDSTATSSPAKKRTKTVRSAARKEHIDVAATPGPTRVMTDYFDLTRDSALRDLDIVKKHGVAGLYMVDEKRE